jgi:hypothetical protein
MILVEQGDANRINEAERITRTILEANMSEIYLGIARTIQTSVHLSRGQAVEAEAAAQRALKLCSAIPTQALSARTGLLKALHLQSRSEEAAEVAREGLALLATLTTGGWSEVAFRVAAAEAFEDNGEREEASRALREALRQIELRASTIPDGAWKERYLVGRPENRRAFELARDWLGEQSTVV